MSNFFRGQIGEYTGSGQVLQWFNNRNSLLTIPANLAAGTESVELQRLVLTQESQDHISITMEIGASGSTVNAPGPDLSSAWENSELALTIEVGAFSYTIPGPFALSIRDADRSDPYNWSLVSGSLRNFHESIRNIAGTGDARETTIQLFDGSSIGWRLTSAFSIQGLGASELIVSPPGRMSAEIPVTGLGAATGLVVRTGISATLPISSIGAATSLDILDAGRLFATLPISGVGSAAELSVDTRIKARLRIRSIGAADNLKVLVAGRISATLPITGLGSATGLAVDTRISATLPITGLGAARIQVRASRPVRVRAQLSIAGTGAALGIDILRFESGAELSAVSSPTAALMTALEIRHPDASSPLRVVDASENKTIDGNTYIAMRFSARLAQDDDSRAPQAELSMDNVGREATRWIEDAGGGSGATVRIIQLIDAPGREIEWEMTLDITRLSLDSERVVARLGFDTGIGRPAVLMRHDPQTTPGIF